MIFKGVTNIDLDFILKYAKSKNTIGKYEALPFIHLPYGIVKKDLPELLKQGDILKVVDLVMRVNNAGFNAEDYQENEIIPFILYIKEQMEFIQKIELENLQSDPDPEMIASGINRLNEFGELVTIDNLAKGDILRYKAIEALPYFEVYQKLKLDKMQREIERNYQKIMEDKIKQRR